MALPVTEATPALLALAGTPPDIIARLNQAINAAAQSKDIQDEFASIGFVVEPGTPEALAQRINVETTQWAKAIRDATIEPQRVRAARAGEPTSRVVSRSRCKRRAGPPTEASSVTMHEVGDPGATPSSQRTVVPRG